MMDCGLDGEELLFAPNHSPGVTFGSDPSLALLDAFQVYAGDELDRVS